jgi:hypothetical protein
MPTPRTEHGSGVVAVGDYAPGSRPVNPAGLSRGVAALLPEQIPHEPVPDPEPAPVKRRGRPPGSRNRPKIPDDEVFDDPPEPA